MAHGTPESRDEIAAFYTRIRRGRPPSAEQLAELESRYAAIGGTSPLNERTEAQVRGIGGALAERFGDRYTVRFGAKHTAPFIEDGANALSESGVETVIALVLTPHSSTLGSKEYLDRARAAVGPDTRFVAVPAWYAHPDFVALMAQRVTTALAPSTSRRTERYRVIFTAHSLPERVRELGDTYADQLDESAQLVARAAGVERFEVCWQSAGRTDEAWLGPDIRDVVRELGRAGETDGVVICPIGFVSDHLEILYDLDIELADVAKTAGVTYTRTASLNDDPAFMAVLADVIGAATNAAS